MDPDQTDDPEQIKEAAALWVAVERQRLAVERQKVMQLKRLVADLTADRDSLQHQLFKDGRRLFKQQQLFKSIDVVLKKNVGDKNTILPGWFTASNDSHWCWLFVELTWAEGRSLNDLVREYLDQTDRDVTHAEVQRLRSAVCKLYDRKNIQKPWNGDTQILAG